MSRLLLRSKSFNEVISHTHSGTSAKLLLLNLRVSKDDIEMEGGSAFKLLLLTLSDFSATLSSKGSGSSLTSLLEMLRSRRQGREKISLGIAFNLFTDKFSRTILFNSRKFWGKKVNLLSDNLKSCTQALMGSIHDSSIFLSDSLLQLTFLDSRRHEVLSNRIFKMFAG